MVGLRLEVVYKLVPHLASFCTLFELMLIRIIIKQRKTLKGFYRTEMLLSIYLLLASDTIFFPIGYI